jgi:hypothetical protein
MRTKSMPSLVLRSAIRTSIALAVAAAAAAPRLAAQVAVLSSTVEEHTAAPGDSYSARIVVSNPGTTPEVVRLYQTDYLFASDGTSHFDEPGKIPRSNAGWISLQSTQVTIPPGTTANIPYTVTVPRADSLRGSYWSTVMVEGAVRPPQTTGAEAGHKAQVGIGTAVRYAIQVATHIGSSGTRSVQFVGTAAQRAADGGSAVVLDVHDVGERAYRPTLWIEVYDSLGALRGKARQSRGLLYPGTSLRQTFDLGKLPPGTYKAVIFADTGEDSVYASQYTVVF